MTCISFICPENLLFQYCYCFHSTGEGCVNLLNFRSFLGFWLLLTFLSCVCFIYFLISAHFHSKEEMSPFRGNHYKTPTHFKISESTWNSQFILTLFYETSTQNLASVSMVSYTRCWMADLFCVSKFLEVKWKRLLVVLYYWNKSTWSWLIYIKGEVYVAHNFGGSKACLWNILGSDKGSLRSVTMHASW